MPDRIQRVPNGLLNLLSLQGGRTPELVADQVVGELELLQFYGLTQLTTQSSSANPAEGTSVALTLSSTAWTILFGASAEFTATGTLTALAGEVRLTRSGMAQALAAQQFTHFGATVTGVLTIAAWPAYPILCPPGSQVSALPNIIGTDASIATLVRAQFGVVG